jgi:hypothetical protein
MTLVAPGCGESGNALWGSIGEVFDLEFDRVDIVMQGGALRIEYVEKGEPDDQWPCRIVVDTAIVTLGKGVRVQGDSFAAAVTVDRVTANGRSFPDISGGFIEFDRYREEDGAHVVGTFTVRFVADEEGSRTLSGNFDGYSRVETGS